MVTNYLAPYPYRMAPMANVGPFTYADGTTFLGMVEQMRAWLNTDLVGEINTTLSKLVDEFEAGIQGQEDKVIATKAEWDTLFSDFMESVSAEIGELNANLFAPVVSPMSYGAVGDGYQLDAAAIQSAVDAAPAGAVLLFPPGKTFALGAGTITVQKPLTLRGGEFTSTTGKAFRATVSGVVFDGLDIAGPGTGVPYAGGNPGIEVAGTQGAYIDADIRNCTITGARDTGIRVEYVKDFIIAGNTVTGFRYGGIMVNSGATGQVFHNIVRDAVQDTVGLSYGIAVTDTPNTEEHRSRDVDVSFNHVENVPLWEGIDTHGGYNIAVIGNTVKNCKNGIVFTVGSNSRTLAPQACRAVGNHVSAPDVTGTTTGIALGGSATGNASHPLYTDAVVTGNSLFNVTVPVSLPTSTGPTVDKKKSVIADNASDTDVYATGDTGWLPATDYGTFTTGYASNSTYPVQVRVIGDTVMFEGVVSRTADTPVNNVFFTLTDTALIPAFDRIMGVGQGTATPYDKYTLSVNTAGSYRTIFPSTAPVTNFTVTGQYTL